MAPGGPLFGPALGRASANAVSNTWASLLTPYGRQKRRVTRFRMRTPEGFSGGPIIDRSSGRAVAMVSTAEPGHQAAYGTPTAFIVADIANNAPKIPLVTDWLIAAFARSADGKRFVDR